MDVAEESKGRGEERNKRDWCQEIISSLLRRMLRRLGQEKGGDAKDLQTKERGGFNCRGRTQGWGENVYKKEGREGTEKEGPIQKQGVPSNYLRPPSAATLRDASEIEKKMSRREKRFRG